MVLKKCGKLAAGKHLPPEAYALEPVKAEALLAGYLSADGHFVARHNRWMASSVSRSLLLGMAMIAQRARGVVVSVYAGREPGRKVIEGLDCNTQQDWVTTIPPQNMSGMILDDGAWKKVRSVEPSGQEEVWDLEVKDDHSYVAEGCVVHNCHPLQLDVIERAIVLWSNPGETVWTPFMGVGSEVYGAVINGRKGAGCELKKAYYDQAVKNLSDAMMERQAVKDEVHPTLFPVEDAEQEPEAVKPDEVVVPQTEAPADQESEAPQAKPCEVSNGEPVATEPEAKPEAAPKKKRARKPKPPKEAVKVETKEPEPQSPGMFDGLM